MTIELSENTETGTLQVSVSGKLTHEDYAEFEPAVSQLIQSCGKIKVLFMMHEFHGWEAGAVWDDIKFATKHCNDISKIAMVGEKGWQKWMATICKPFTMSKIEYFESGQENEAGAWLAS